MPKYFYEQHGQQCGPITGQELQVRARRGQVDLDAIVWVEGSTERSRAENVRNLFHNHSEAFLAPAASPSLTPEPPVSTLPERYRRRHRNPWRDPNILIGGFVGLLLLAILIWYLNAWTGADLFGSNRRAVISLVGERLGSNEWNIKKWGKPYSTDGCKIKYQEKGWSSVKPGRTAYPFTMETLVPAFGWESHDYIAILESHKALDYFCQEYWRRPTKVESAETAKQHLLSTAIKMEGPFARVVQDIIVSVEEGVPWSIADSRMQNPGNFSFSPETMKAYREWREKALTAQ